MAVESKKIGQKMSQCLMKMAVLIFLLVATLSIPDCCLVDVLFVLVLWQQYFWNAFRRCVAVDDGQRTLDV